MTYIFIVTAIIALFGAAFFLSGSISLRKRDEHAIKHYHDDAYAQQTLNQLHDNHHHHF
ncbi:hypothetical protein [Brevibacillus fluminis]|uniref:hypothetical protein n=1 Tax=Brevibacillus fluminis TaxID=511487 RepID=UPI0016061292|nr:hypothetical protein [Brevibacillus fluminis]